MFRLCSKHRKSVLSMLDIKNYSHLSYNTTLDPSYEIDDSRDSVNRILCEVRISPVKSRTSKALKEQSKSGVRHLLSKLQRSIQLFQGINR